MAHALVHRGFRRARQAFRWCRIALLFLVFLLVFVALYWLVAGIPEFVKRPILDHLRHRGIETNFRDLRWHWFRGFVAEDIRLRFPAKPAAPRLTAREIEVGVHWGALLHSRLEITHLFLREGRCLWLPDGTNQTALALEDIAADIAFPTPDETEIHHLRGRLGNLSLSLDGTITNLSLLRVRARLPAPAKPKPGLPAPVKPKTGPRDTPEARLARFVTWLNRFQMRVPSQISLHVRGNAEDADSLQATLKADLPHLDTPWARAENLHLLASAKSFQDKPPFGLNLIHISLSGLESRWVTNGQVECHLDLATLPENPQEVSANIQLALDTPQTPWGRAARLHLTGCGTLPLTTHPLPHFAYATLALEHPDSPWGQVSNATLCLRLNRILPLPFAPTNTTNSGRPTSPKLLHALQSYEVSAELDLAAPVTRWGSAAHTRLNLNATPAPNTVFSPEDSLNPWRWIEPWKIEAVSEVQALQSPQLKIESAALSLRWLAPELTVNNLSARLCGGQIKASAELDTLTREVQAQAAFDLDGHQIAHLLTPAGRKWIRQFGWEKPPQVEATLEATLPAWTNRHPQWRDEVLPTVLIRGRFSGGAGSFRSLPVNSASGSFLCSNACWTLPDLRAVRPDGDILLGYTGSMLTQDYRFDISGRMNPSSLRPLLEPPQQKALDQVVLHEPVTFQLVASGRWHDLDRFALRADLAATNLAVRGLSVDTLTGSVDYTNKLLMIRRAHLTRGNGFIEAPQVDIDFLTHTFYVSNVTGVMDLEPVYHVFSPEVPEAMAPYQFAEPPRVTVNGTYRGTKIEGADLHFDVAGGRFTWNRFELDSLSGRADWTGRTLGLTNLVATAYAGGHLQGWAAFAFDHDRGSDFTFGLLATHLDLRAAARPFGVATNRLTGRLSGDILITRANSRRWDSVDGQARLTLTNGHIWQVPLFGIFSPVLDAVSPGLGQSVAREAAASFVLTNGVGYTENLEIAASAYRLLYRGTVDLQERVNARVEAEMLGDTWLVGPVLRLALMPLTKIFEYKVTGSIRDPRMQPLYIPKILMAPLRPFHTLKSIFEPNSAKPPKPEEKPAP